MNKNQEELNSFVEYCTAHPEQRFWQALLNWSHDQYSPDISKILIATGYDVCTGGDPCYAGLEDTFHW